MGNLQAEGPQVIAEVQVDPGRGKLADLETLKTPAVESLMPDVGKRAISPEVAAMPIEEVQKNILTAAKSMLGVSDLAIKGDAQGEQIVSGELVDGMRGITYSKRASSPGRAQLQVLAGPQEGPAPAAAYTYSINASGAVETASSFKFVVRAEGDKDVTIPSRRTVRSTVGAEVMESFERELLTSIDKLGLRGQ